MSILQYPNMEYLGDSDEDSSDSLYVPEEYVDLAVTLSEGTRFIEEIVKGDVWKDDFYRRDRLNLTVNEVETPTMGRFSISHWSATEISPGQCGNQEQVGIQVVRIIESHSNRRSAVRTFLVFFEER